MKFKFNLDEALFDDAIDAPVKVTEHSTYDDFDDDFSSFEDEHSVENVLPGPTTGPATAGSTELIALISDEWEAIQGYNDAIATFRSLSESDPFYSDAIKVLEEIAAEENTHVGQLQELLKRISPNVAEIQEGTKEAKSQLGFVGGVLPVQSWDTPAHKPSSDCTEEETCTLTDIDDEM